MSTRLIHADCLEALPELSGVDAIVTDPPYGLGFMGKAWDHGVPGVPFWETALGAVKPGAHLLAFGGTRTFHRLACAIEDAGWEIRDTVMWVYGSGFPKSLDVSKAIDKAAGATREVVGQRHVTNAAQGQGLGHGSLVGGTVQAGLIDVTAPATDDARRWEGWGTALKPAWEPIIVARKPLEGTVAANVLKYGTGAMDIDSSRVAWAGPEDAAAAAVGYSESMKRGSVKAPTSLPTVYDKPPYEPDKMLGRWPANLIHDGSEEVVRLFPEPHGAGHAREGSANPRAVNYSGHVPIAPVGNTGNMNRFGDDGSAARFFYTAKADASDRGPGNDHPTVKPTALMEYLIRLVTPFGATVLDPFMGSGSTGVACIRTGRAFVGIEKDAHNFEIARKRIEGSPNQQALL